jgi:pimeloyl-ACP methyl ester carboxylesterase
MHLKDAGLADEHWHGYYSPDELKEIVDNSVTTMIVSERCPIHIRLFLHPVPAPLVVMSHGLLPYGLSLVDLQLPFFRAGFNVLQWDLPGFGQSGGPRGGSTIPQIIETWKDVLAFAQKRFGGPLYVKGFAEDGVTAYYAGANNPHVAAMALHILCEYGDPDNVHWLGPAWMVQIKSVGMAVMNRLRPTFSVKATKAIPWDDVFGRKGASVYRTVFENDPLRNEVYEIRLAHSMVKKNPPPVSFEQCRTPVQIIASERSKIWPYRMNKRSYERLGGPKELITLEGKPHWEFNRPFVEAYCAHAIKWFIAQGANPIPAGRTGSPG